MDCEDCLMKLILRDSEKHIISVLVTDQDTYHEGVAEGLLKSLLLETDIAETFTVEVWKTQAMYEKATRTPVWANRFYAVPA